MKKVSSIILLLIILCCSCLTACNSAQSQIPGEHNYIEGVCSICGAKDISYIAPCNHVYIDGECSICGENDPTYVAPCAHKYINGACNKCGEFDEAYCEEIYLEILSECLSMENKRDSVTTIQEKLALLPANYKDVGVLKEQVTFVKKQFDIFSDTIFKYLMKILVDESEKKDYYIDYIKVQRAYMALINADAEYKHWDLTSAAEDWIYESADSNCDGILLLSVCVGLWEDNEGNYMNFVESETNSMLFGSNLPSAMDSNKSYGFFVDGRVIGYQAAGETTKINAYRIMQITETYISVYNFKNGYTYRLMKK